MRPHLVFLSAIISAFPLKAADTAIWSDKSLPVSEGLELWLDASRENEAREAYLMNRLRSGDAMEFWHDSSGHLRHAAQWDAAARPLWRSDNGGAGVWFSGSGFLAALITPPVTFKEATVFVVAAPAKSQASYAGLFSAARRGADDYRSGLNIDLGSKPAQQWSAVSVEGAGQSGERNLLKTPVDFGAGHVLALRTAPGENGTGLRFDGQPQGARSRGDVAWALDMFSVGARLVGEPPAIQHHFNGGIAEVLVYGRRLDDGQTAQMEAWLGAKHAAFLRGPDTNGPRKIASHTDKDAAVVQMLVPGFTVRELPVQVTALNNIEYAADGRLFAGGYDGRFHVLRDTDGDGLEDKVDTFSPATTDNFPLGMAVKDGNLYALLANEIVRFRDTKGDGIPDLRETVVTGWDDPVLQKEPLLNHRRVDSSLAFAIGSDGAYYTTMGSAAYTNGYWLDKEGKSHYTTDKLRGCLLRITPDGHVENLCSGLRYVISMQWNRYGDLFATDQEGATWLPNGNPLDELLCLEKGRHYGFPPRHPKWLPNVVDEPSVWDYAPQHQSTCGFRFNGPQKDRARFGPEFWSYDAFVTGESRGKIWRTSLAKTEAGYVGQTQLVACLGMLTVDCAISPKGDLVVCCHAGPPDWGKGPSAIGRIFKISHTDPAAPLPVLAWAASPTETVVAFDKPLDNSWQDGPDLAKRAQIEFGRFVSAADRFETIRPGYAVVTQIQQREPRFELPVKGARLGEDRRSLVIETASRMQAVDYAMTLSEQRAPAADPKAIPQHPATDLAFELTGLAAEWRGADGSAWDGWLPHPDFIAAREFTRGSAAHDVFWRELTQPGELTLRSRLNLWNMLRPATQPGSKLDYEQEAENVTMVFKSDAALALDAPPAPGTQVQRINEHESRLTVTGVRESVWPIFTLKLASPARALDVSYFTSQDANPRAPGTRRFYLPFATPPGPLANSHTIPEIAGGNWENGHALFKTKGACIQCHAIRGEGVVVGPDLSNQMHRDYASVMKDIVDPNEAVNPDAVGYTVTLKDGSAVIGTRAGETGEELQIAQPGGAIAKIQKADIARKEPMTVSLMPAGLLQALSPQEVKDLMTFLLTPPPGHE